MSEYRPHVGSNITGEEIAPPSPPPDSYADLTGLRAELESLLNDIADFKEILEDDLHLYALHIDEDDEKLIDAYLYELPDELRRRDQISYRFYKAMRLRNTASAEYIRKRFEEAARDVTGTTALDYLKLVNLMEEEAFRVQHFLDTYVEDATDSSELRTIELFQDWVVSAQGYVAEFEQSYQDNEVAPSQ